MRQGERQKWNLCLFLVRNSAPTNYFVIISIPEFFTDIKFVSATPKYPDRQPLSNETLGFCQSRQANLSSNDLLYAALSTTMVMGEDAFKRPSTDHPCHLKLHTFKGKVHQVFLLFDVCHLLSKNLDDKKGEKLSQKLVLGRSCLSG